MSFPSYSSEPLDPANLMISHSGLIGLKEVYKIDPATGSILCPEDISLKMVPALPKCPNCQLPIRQYATQRYNRLINRAVIDEMSKRFVVTGQRDLHDIEGKLNKVETELENTCSDVTKANAVSLWIGSPNQPIEDITRKLRTRYQASAQLRADVVELQRSAAERHQPAHKLHEATVHAMQLDAPLRSALANLKLEDAALMGERDHRITLGAKMMEIRIDCITMEDKFRVLSDVRAKYGDSASSVTFPGSSPLILAELFFKSCTDFITRCREKALPKLAVEASLFFARISRLFETCRSSDPKKGEMATKHSETAKNLLEEAVKLCDQGFRDADTLLEAANESLKLLQKSYEEVTADELEAIKRAMVSGPKGLATHSGHWYNCVNGHPVCQNP